ncbi:proline-, glutamic acid- and leucine-rich protein 1-like [Drosophila miranda]|uniref:proline-, glutamic acid- and leucine-rich protein 1-like n=1 Tax=Drosophila miranda TaxID=7229 RepID=UPI00143F1BC5|nr:proline-, glutamic acid- and leucine-rich protein 1-like [Drosophila miranda]
MHSEMLSCVSCVYKSLYDVLCTRVIWDDENHCRCAWTSAVPSQISTISTMTAEIEVLFLKQNMAPSKLQGKPRKLQCECSQEPYVCRWLRYDEEEEQFKEHRVPFPPIEPAYDEGAGEEEHHGERLSATGIEDHDTDYCWLAPFRDWPRVGEEPVDEPEEEASMTPNSEEEEALFQCRCTCEIKQRAFPHLFTYLAPFKPIKPVVEEVPSAKDPEKCEEEEGTEDLLAKPPPCGVSLATYHCWLKPTPPPSDPESVTEEQPHIAVLAQGAKPKVAGISMDVTVKGQHHQKGSDVAKPSGPAPASKSRRSTTKTPNLRISMPAQAAAPKAPPKPAPTAVPAPALAPAPVATPPAAKPPPTQAPAQVNQEEKLTEEDILNIIGL